MIMNLFLMGKSLPNFFPTSSHFSDFTTPEVPGDGMQCATTAAHNVCEQSMNI